MQPKPWPRRGHHDQARQSVHWHVPGRARTPSVPVDADHSLPSPLSPRIAMTSAHAQTTPLVLRCAVDAVIVDLCHHGLRGRRRLPSDSVLPLLQTDAPHDRLDVAYRTLPSSCPFAAPDDVAMVDLTRTPRPPLDSIKGEPPRLNPSHHLAPLPLLTLLNPSLLHIVHPAAAI
jgi:hypothetical protein